MMRPEHALALIKAAGTKAVKDAASKVPVGEHAVDCRFDIIGSVKQGEGYSQVQSTAINWRGAFVRSMLDRGIVRLVKVPGRKVPRLRFRDKEARKIFTDMIRMLDSGVTEADKVEQKEAEAALGRWFSRVLDKSVKVHKGKTTAKVVAVESTPEAIAVESEAEATVRA
jgi:hypothetical protein